MEDQDIIIDWQDPYSSKWSERWNYDVGLYSVVHPRSPELLYVGKLDGCTARERYNARDKHLRVWQPLEQERGLFEHGFIVGEFRTPPGLRLTQQLVSDIESLLIIELQPWANIQYTQSRRYSRPDMTVRCTGNWPHRRRSFRAPG